MPYSSAYKEGYGATDSKQIRKGLEQTEIRDGNVAIDEIYTYGVFYKLAWGDFLPIVQ